MKKEKVLRNYTVQWWPVPVVNIYSITLVHLFVHFYTDILRINNFHVIFNEIFLCYSTVLEDIFLCSLFELGVYNIYPVSYFETLMWFSFFML